MGEVVGSLVLSVARSLARQAFGVGILIAFFSRVLSIYDLS